MTATKIFTSITLTGDRYKQALKLCPMFAVFAQPYDAVKMPKSLRPNLAHKSRIRRSLPDDCHEVVKAILPLQSCLRRQLCFGGRKSSQQRKQYLYLKLASKGPKVLEPAGC